MLPLTHGWFRACWAVIRMDGSTCRSLLMKSLASSETCGQCFPSQLHLHTMTFSRILGTLRALNGVRPDNRKYTKIPTAHMSTSPPIPCSATPFGSLTTSGATNSGVPPGSVGTWKKVARLKSISLMGDSLSLRRSVSKLQTQHTFHTGETIFAVWRTAWRDSRLVW